MMQYTSDLRARWWEPQAEMPCTVSLRTAHRGALHCIQMLRACMHLRARVSHAWAQQHSVRCMSCANRRKFVTYVRERSNRRVLPCRSMLICTACCSQPDAERCAGAERRTAKRHEGQPELLCTSSNLYRRPSVVLLHLSQVTKSMLLLHRILHQACNWYQQEPGGDLLFER